MTREIKRRYDGSMSSYAEVSVDNTSMPVILFRHEATRTMASHGGLWRSLLVASSLDNAAWNSRTSGTPSG